MIRKKKPTIIISLIILLGVIFSNVVIYINYNKELSENTRIIAELSTMNIYSEINNELTKPIYVSLTMANDNFVKDWLEDTSTVDQDIVDYLNGIKEKYNYSSVFLVNNSNGKYYRYDGLHKTISVEDEHDVWYYTFVNSNETYKLDVDTDEANGELTIFVNARLEDELGNLLAVVGVGVQMTYVQTLIKQFEDDFELEAFLIDSDGEVQSHSNTAFIEQRNIFDEELYQNFQTEITENLESMEVSNKSSEYVITRYVDELDWYIVVQKDTHIMIQFASNFIFVNMIMLIATVSIIGVIVNKLINNHQEKVYDIAIKDHLTQLLNRRGFDNEFKRIINSDVLESMVFMIDIDHFKNVNDKFGHVQGDEVLRRISRIMDDIVSVNGILSRWGGDEFAGIMIGDRTKLENTLNDIINAIGSDEDLKSKGISASVGYTYTKQLENSDIILRRVDTALYKSKTMGKGLVSKS